MAEGTTPTTPCPSCGKRNRVPVAASGTPVCGACRAPLPWVGAADDEAAFDSALGAKVPVLVDLWAPWCGPCRVMDPILDELAGQHAGRVKFTKLNVDDNFQTAARYDILSIPTVMVFEGGQMQKKLIGALPRRRIEDELATWLGAGSGA